MTKLELLNRIIQILFIRIAIKTDRKVNKKYVSVLFFVIPFTGWKSSFIGFIKSIDIYEIKK
jgi:hypothetical protein